MSTAAGVFFAAAAVAIPRTPPSTLRGDAANSDGAGAQSAQPARPASVQSHDAQSVRESAEDERPRRAVPAKAAERSSADGVRSHDVQLARDAPEVHYTVGGCGVRRLAGQHSARGAMVQSRRGAA